MTKICKMCKKELPLDSFSKRTVKRKNGEVYYRPLTLCKKCNSKYSLENKKKNKIEGVYYVYRLMDKDDNILYIGKTEDLNRRIKSHFSTSHLPKECINSIEKVEYIVMSLPTLMHIREIYYISLFKPKYNNVYNYDEPAVKLTEFLNDKWCLYDEDEVKKIRKAQINFESEVKYITSIFKRKRNNKYYVYIEYLYNKKDGFKKQKLQGSFYDEKEADIFLNQLKTSYKFKV